MERKISSSDNNIIPIIVKNDEIKIEMPKEENTKQECQSENIQPNQISDNTS